MVMRWDRRAVVMGVAAAGLVACAAIAGDDAQTIRPVRVPVAVREAARKSAPGVRFTKAFRYADEGRPRYVLAGKDAHGREVSIDADGRGKVDRVETSVTMDEVPKEVRDVLVATRRRDAKARRWRFTDIKRVTDDEGGNASYRFEGPDEHGEIVGLLDIQVSRRK
jgi:hypothetical protein